MVTVGNPITVTKSVLDFSEIVKADMPGVRTGVAATGGLVSARWIAITITPGHVGLCMCADERVVMTLVETAATSFIAYLGMFLTSDRLLTEPYAAVTSSYIPAFPPMPPVGKVCGTVSK